ncbi:MAG: hypothetical protein NTW28_17750, partial [Candidatus Solibacter sp.]|nr:hypothetical protein [Candidatus Solibacter sp.]
MAIKSAPINLLPFPQSWQPPRLFLNVLVLPKGDPLAFNPSFPDCLLTLEAAIIPSTQSLPTAASVSLRLPLELIVAANRPALFTALANEIPVRAHDGPVAPHPAVQVKKSLTGSYANATVGGRPRTPFLVAGDEYACAVRDAGAALPPPAGPPPRDFFWEEIYGFVLRQPLLARELGLIYETFVDLPDPQAFARGGYLYVDVAPGSDYSALPRSLFAARIPALADARRVFASVLFPVDDAGNFDHVSAEASAYDDGFAKIVHGTQARTAAVIESSRNAMPPVKDTGIRLGWDDEQVAVWLNRQLGVNAYDPGLPPPGSPLGVAAYRVDVFDDAADQWQSLNRAQGDLALAGIPIGNFDDELGVETLPSNLTNNPTGEFWLPSFFTTWAGGSLVVTDPTPFQIAGNTDPVGNPVYSPVGGDAVPLRYGSDYRFRVRLADLSGGGPRADEAPLNPARASVAKVPFRRFSPPKAVRAIRTDPEPRAARAAHYQVFRPVLGYPDIAFTAFPNAVAALLAQTAQAQVERREPALPDPDATQVRIDVAVRTLTRDPLADSVTAQPFVPVYSTTRNFPEDPNEAIELEVVFTDGSTLAPFQAGPVVAEGPLLLPSARAVRLTFTPVGKPDDAGAYWGSEAARLGSAPISLYLSAPSAGEPNLLLPPALGPQIMAIFLQPDPPRTPVQIAALAAAGLRHQAPADLASRLAAELDVPHSGLTFSAPSGTRTVFACSTALRHTLNPDCSSISFSAKTDLIHYWVVALRFTIDRDWTWNALADPAFEVLRDGVVVGRIQLPGILGDAAWQQADRNHTSVIFIDAFDPKPGPPPDFPAEIDTVYTLRPLFRTPPADVDPPFEWKLRLPVTTPPRQTPKLLSAGFAFGPYQPGERYRSTAERPRMLYLQFQGPPGDPKDQYFGRVLAYGPDPMLISSSVQVPDPAEPPLPMDPEEIRVITVNQPNDFAGFNAMQPLIESRESPGFYLLPLPPGLDPDSPELFGFFVYELRVGHSRQRWCTAQARFGRPLRVAGVQHPAPPLRSMVSRTSDRVRVVSPYAAPVLNGRNIRANAPNTQIHALLYAQVLQADAQSWRNILIARAPGAPLSPGDHVVEDPRFLPALMEFQQTVIVATLRQLGLPLDSPLSVVAVEMLPENPGKPNPAVFVRVQSPLGADLGQVRILRASALTPVPAICPPKV